MNLDDIKNELKKFEDLYGSKLFDYEKIDKSETIEELYQILDSHYDHITGCLDDAQSHLNNFIQKIKQMHENANRYNP